MRVGGTRGYEEYEGYEVYIRGTRGLCIRGTRV